MTVLDFLVLHRGSIKNSIQKSVKNYIQFRNNIIKSRQENAKISPVTYEVMLYFRITFLFIILLKYKSLLQCYPYTNFVLTFEPENSFKKEGSLRGCLVLRFHDLQLMCTHLYSETNSFMSVSENWTKPLSSALIWVYLYRLSELWFLYYDVRCRKVNLRFS